jgi:pSer/pThr/pTyr-binding forkhead associated (FHA) protein
VHSLGAILYLCLTGKAPYGEGNPVEVVMQLLGPDLPPGVRHWRPEIPESLERICMKCLNKQPEQRYATANALAEALRRFRDAPPSSPKPAALPAVTLVMPANQHEVHLTRPINLIGRAEGCTLILRASDVSKRHCRVLLEADRVIVEDLGSANGTFVNDQPVQQTPLHDGDVLRVGRHVFQVRIQGTKS